MCWNKVDDINCFQMPLLLPYHFMLTPNKLVGTLHYQNPKFWLRASNILTKQAKTSGISSKPFFHLRILPKMQSSQHVGIDGWKHMKGEPFFTKNIYL